MDDQAIPRKAPEQIRVERIAAIDDAKLRQQIDGLASARDIQLAQVKDRQKQTLDKRVEELRDQKIGAANAAQLIQTNDIQYPKNPAREHNEQIGKRLDAPREATRPAAASYQQHPSLSAAPQPWRGPANPTATPSCSGARSMLPEQKRQKPTAKGNEQDRQRGPER